MLQAKTLKAMKRRPVYRRELKRVRPAPTLEQQLKAIDDLSNMLTDEEKEIFGKIMDEMENKND